MKLTTIRHSLQVLVLLLLAILPWLNAHEFTFLQGSFFALNFGPIPFADPVAALQVSCTLNFASKTVLLGALASLLVALILGRVFCGWICPYGLLSELVTRFGQTLFKVSLNPKLKIIFLVLGLLIFALTSYPLLNLISYPGELSLLPILLWQGDPLLQILLAAILPLTLLALEFATSQRLWCKNFCPQSVLLGLAASLKPKKLPGLEITWVKTKCSCKGRPPCSQVCSVNLTPRHLGGPKRQDCLHCGACVEVCQSHGQALQWRFLSHTD